MPDTFPGAIDELVSESESDISPSTVSIQDTNISKEKCELILEKVESLRRYITGRNLIVKIRHNTGAFEYTLNWEEDGHADADEQNDQNLEPSQIFQDSDEQSSISALRRNRISGRGQIGNILVPLATSDTVDIDFSYYLDSTEIAQYFEESLEYEIDVSYYFSEESFKRKVENADIGDLREIFYTERGKKVVLIHGLESESYGTDIGLFSDEQLTSSTIKDFCERSISAKDYEKDIRRECAIDYFDEQYVAPTYFRLDTGDDSDLAEYFQKEMIAPQLIYSILGISNIARSLEAGGWEVRINGRRVVESRFKVKKLESSVEIHETTNGQTDRREISQEQVNKFVEVFDWIYSARVQDRITVFRNIAAIYSTSVMNLVSEIGEISKSSRNNFRFYVRESVEDFMDVQQDISSYVFETQREMSDLRRGLANNLNRDLFRVFGFTAVAWIAIISGISELASLKLALTISLFPAIVYILLGIRSTYALDQQYSAIKDGQKKYYKMYENRIDESVLNDIKNVDGSDTMDREFKWDKRIYYTLFGVLLLICILLIVDIGFSGPVIDWVTSISRTQPA